MSWLTKTLTSSIGKKLLMSLTGLFLCTFLIVHLVGNLQLFKHDAGFAFNAYAVFMTTNPLIKTVSYGLYTLILFHAFWGMYLELQNRKARPSAYAVVKNSSSWASRNMAILGTILLVYIAVHMADFWWEYHNGPLPYTKYVENLQTGEVTSERMAADYTQGVKKVEFVDVASESKVVIMKDLYEEVSEGFSSSLLLVVFYVISMAVLGFHLAHGFQSAFQTLGVNHSKYTPFIKTIGIWVFAILIPLGYALMPLYFYFLK